MSLLPEQAQRALKEEDWLVLNQYLQQMLTVQSTHVVTTQSRLAGQEQWGRSLTLALQVLETGDFQAQWEVAKLLPGFGERAIAPLIELLHDLDTDEEVRWFAARILGDFRHPAVIPALLELLQSTDVEELRTAAANALANQGQQVIPVMRDLLQHPETRLVAVQAFAQIGTEETIALLIPLAKVDDASVRLLAIEALSQFRDDRVVAVMLNAIADPLPEIRCTAIQWVCLRSDLVESHNLVVLVGDRLWDVDLAVCRAAALGLGRFGTDAAVLLLWQAMQNPVTPLPLQQAIVQALAWIGNTTALEYLSQILAQPDCDPVLRGEVLTLLGRWSEPTLQTQVADQLLEFANSHTWANDSAVRAAIALALGQLGQTVAIDPLLRWLTDADIKVRLHTIAALKQFNLLDVKNRLAAIAYQTDLSTEMQQGIAIALKELGIKDLSS